MENVVLRKSRRAGFVHVCIKAVFTAVVAMVMAGCASFGGGSRGEEILRVEDCKVVLSGNRSMREVVVAAAHGKMWMPEDRGPNTVRCTLDVRGHQAVVDVVFTESSFSIRYVSSENLNYDAASGRISPKYNQWVRNLRREIAGQAVKR